MTRSPRSRRDWSAGRVFVALIVALAFPFYGVLFLALTIVLIYRRKRQLQGITFEGGGGDFHRRDAETQRAAERNEKKDDPTQRRGGRESVAEKDERKNERE